MIVCAVIVTGGRLVRDNTFKKTAQRLQYIANSSTHSPRTELFDVLMIGQILEIGFCITVYARSNTEMSALTPVDFEG